MKTCAQCRKELAAAAAIDHGMCSICALEMTKEAPRTVGKILNSIHEPVFLIDNDGVVQGANRSASKMLNKELPDIEGQLGGDAFECSYAKDKGGCGRTVHCKTCAIRNIVMDMITNGHGYDKVPAFQAIETPNGPSISHFIITTEKFGRMVLLRVDRPRKGFST